VTLFVSGEEGWSGSLDALARALAGDGAIVVGVDLRRYLAALGRGRERCAYPAADFEALSQWMQRRLDRPAYAPPVLVGYAAGGALVYAVLVQAPPGTFRGAVSLGFCPVLALRRPLCRGSGTPIRVSRPGRRGPALVAADSVSAPWTVLQGEDDSRCPLSQVDSFVRRVRGATLVPVARAGTGLADPSLWAGPLRDALVRSDRPADVRAPTAEAVRDLPLVELPVRAGSGALAVIVSGDGGWASLDRQVGETFAARGVPTVGLNSLQYFWTRRTPDGAAADLTRILRHYLDAWRAGDVVLVGYSRGASVLPFMASRLPAELRARVRAVALLSPGRTAGFEFHLSDWLPGPPHGNVLPTAPEIAKLRGMRVLCVYGTDDRDAVCPDLPAGLVTSLARRGGHHIGGGYRELADTILQAAGVSSSGSDRHRNAR
jgi:type IV secretory pathway VirJ component